MLWLEGLIDVIVIGCKFPEDIKLLNSEKFNLSISAIQLLNDYITELSWK